MKIKARITERSENAKVQKASVKDTLVIENGGQDISLKLSESDIFTYTKNENDLILNFENGHTLTIKDYFLPDSDGAKNRLFLSESGDIAAVDLTHLAPEVNSALDEPASGLVFRGSGWVEAVILGSVALVGFVAVLDSRPLFPDRSEPEVTEPQAPTFQPRPISFSDGSEPILGSAEPGSTVNILSSTGELLGTGAPDPVTGEFSIMPSRIFEDGETIRIVSVDEIGAETEIFTTTIDTQAPNVPVINSADGELITGAAELGSVVRIFDIDGNMVGAGATDAVTGEFSIQLLSSSLENGDIIRTVAIDSSGNESAPTEETIEILPSAPSADDVDELEALAAFPDDNVNLLIGVGELALQAGPSRESIPLQSDFSIMDINKAALLDDTSLTRDAKIDVDLVSFIGKSDIDLGAFNSSMDVISSRPPNGAEMTVSEVVGGAELSRDDQAVSVV